MQFHGFKTLVLGVATSAMSVIASAQVPQYGTSIKHETARKVVAAAIA